MPAGISLVTLAVSVKIRMTGGLSAWMNFKT
jgi:hypothetical protein